MFTVSFNTMDCRFKD